MTSIIAICILPVLATGCFAPSPHTSERLHKLEGHVVDASTGQPIEGAKVAIQGHPHDYKITDKKGYFYFHKENNWHIGYFAFIEVPENVPRGQYWAAAVDISHRGYISRQIDAASPALQLGLTNNQQQLEFWELVNMRGSDAKPIPPFVLKDIALTPSNTSPPNIALEPTATTH